MKASRVQMLILLLVSLYLPVGNAYGQKPRDEAQKITVVPVQSKAATVTQPYVCKIHAQRYINVRVLERGFLDEIKIKEGQTVKKGDLMFKIIPILRQAKLDANTAEAQLAQLEIDFAKKLLDKNLVPQNEVQLLKAKLAKAEAKRMLAKAELNFTNVTAPFDGIIGRLREKKGQLVEEGDILTTLSDESVMWVYFEMPEAQYLEYLNDVKQKKEKPKIELKLADGKKFNQPGKIGAIEGRFNNSTGDIPFRADFPNPEGVLHHDQTGTLLIKRVVKDAILLVPRRATFEGPYLWKRYVYVVDKDHVAHRREIVIEDGADDVSVVKEGVGVGDRIVVDGVGLVHDGDKVE